MRLCALLLFAFAVATHAGDWPQFRDPTGLGYTEERDLPQTWNAKTGENIAKHFVVVGKGGFSETKDGGVTWRPAAPLPPDFKIARVGPNFAWDPRAEIFYASKMTKPTFKFQRP